MNPLDHCDLITALRFIYTGSVDVDLEIAHDLLKAADQYLLEGLKRQCEHAIAQVGKLFSISFVNTLLLGYVLSDHRLFVSPKGHLCGKRISHV